MRSSSHTLAGGGSGRSPTNVSLTQNPDSVESITVNDIDQINRKIVSIKDPEERRTVEKRYFEEFTRLAGRKRDYHISNSWFIKYIDYVNGRDENGSCNAPSKIVNQNRPRNGNPLTPIGEPVWLFLSKLYGYDVEVADGKNGLSTLGAEQSVSKEDSKQTSAKTTSVNSDLIDHKREVQGSDDNDRYPYRISDRPRAMNPVEVRVSSSERKRAAPEISVQQPIVNPATVKSAGKIESTSLQKKVSTQSAKDPDAEGEAVWKKDKLLVAGSSGEKIKVNKSFQVEPIGLMNNSLYCFMNAVLQCWAHIPELSQYFYYQKYKTLKNYKSSSKWNTCNLFAEFIEGYAKCSKKVYNPSGLKRYFAEDFDGASEQHDAHEFFIALREKLRDEMNLLFPKNRPKIIDASSYWNFHSTYNDSVIDQLFSGLQVATVTCDSCKHEENVYEPFLELFLPLERGSTSIFDCMERYLKSERIPNYSCDQCKKKDTQALKKTHLSLLPRFLVISLKRFKMGTYKQKIYDVVDYPLELDLSRFAPKAQSPRYTLISLIIHLGSIDSGHYVCFSKVGDQWCFFDDEDLKPAQTRDVTKREAYILIYRQID